MNRTSPEADDVIEHARRKWGDACGGCGTALVGHDAVLGLMLGFVDESICIACLAAHHERTPTEFVTAAHWNVRRLACYRAGWSYSDERLDREGGWPEDRVPRRLRMPIGDALDDAVDADEDTGEQAEHAAESDLVGALAASVEVETWDAGDRGCGELALELRMRVRRLPPGTRLLLVTTDRGAPADVPAWCRLTGHALVAAAPPRFLIEGRSGPPSPPFP